MFNRVTRENGLILLCFPFISSFGVKTSLNIQVCVSVCIHPNVYMCVFQTKVAKILLLQNNLEKTQLQDTAVYSRCFGSIMPAVSIIKDSHVLCKRTRTFFLRKSRQILCFSFHLEEQFVLINSVYSFQVLRKLLRIQLEALVVKITLKQTNIFPQVK